MKNPKRKAGDLTIGEMVKYFDKHGLHLHIQLVPSLKQTPSKAKKQRAPST